MRQYSLCNAPGEGVYRIAVKPEANGRGGSVEAHEHLVPGTAVTISEPRSVSRAKGDRVTLDL
ncbi:MAG: hypothetical protein ACT4QG_03565 [Sporichthyaceae bacterium]